MSDFEHLLLPLRERTVNRKRVFQIVLLRSEIGNCLCDCFPHFKQMNSQNTATNRHSRKAPIFTSQPIKQLNGNKLKFVNRKITTISTLYNAIIAPLISVN